MFRVADRHQQRQGRPVAKEHLVLDEILRDPLLPALILGLSKCQGIGLGEEVGHQFIMVGHWLTADVDGILGRLETNEVRRYRPTLM